MTNEEAINYFERSYASGDTDDERQHNEALDKAIKALKIELLTDTEQRIFLKAINREREVCQKVDDEYPDDDLSLAKVCNSIERKVKKIWER
jgi:hypothetical protein